jgi:hypothetical protein
VEEGNAMRETYTKLLFSAPIDLMDHGPPEGKGLWRRGPDPGRWMWNAVFPGGGENDPDRAVIRALNIKHPER